MTRATALKAKMLGFDVSIFSEALKAEKNITFIQFENRRIEFKFTLYNHYMCI